MVGYKGTDFIMIVWLNNIAGYPSTSVGRYHIFTSGIRYYKLRTVFSIPRYLIKQVDESLSSVNG